MTPRQHSALRLLASLALAALAPAAWAGVNVWTPVGPEGGQVGILAIEPGTKALFAGSRSGLYRSADGGALWERRSRRLAGAVNAISFATAPQRTIYVATEVELYSSTNGGVTWTPIGDHRELDSGFYSVAAARDNASVVYAGTPFRGVLRSTDAGATWEETSDFDCGFVWSLAVDPRHPETVYAVCGQSDVSPVFKSTDGGATWEPKASGLPAGDYYPNNGRIVISPDAPDTLFLSLQVSAEEVATFRSRDGGEHWQRVGPGGGLALAAGRSGMVFSGPYRSTDGGDTWTAVSSPAPITSYAVDPAAPGTVYRADVRGVSKSTDGGTTWTPVNRGLYLTSIEELVIDPRQPSTLYAYANGVGLLKTVRGGSRWRHADAGLPDPVGDLQLWPPAVAVDSESTVYFGWIRGLARSTDGGVTWSILDQEQCVDVRDLAIDPQAPANLYAVGTLFTPSCASPAQRCPIFRSADAGATWTCAAPPIQYADRVVVDPVQPSRLYAVSVTSGLWRSNDRGAHWVRLRGGSIRFVEPTWLAVDPVDPRRLYLGTLTGEIHKSTDGGRSWVKQSRGLPGLLFSGPIRSILVNPERPQTVYAGTSAGPYLTTNGGRTWYPLNGGLPSFSGHLALDPQNPDKLYAGTSNGVYTYERRE